jgi:hypothetical protein
MRFQAEDRRSVIGYARARVSATILNEAVVVSERERNIIGELNGGGDLDATPSIGT